VLNPLPITTGNPLASRWQMDSSVPEETPQGFRDEWFEYTMNFTVSANTFAQNLYIILDGDADFVLRQIEPNGYQSGTPTTQYGAYRLKDCFGNPLSDDLVSPGDVFGPIFTEIVLQKGRRVFLDWDNTQQAFELIIAVILRGCKRFPR
jgi:hypothetical protein